MRGKGYDVVSRLCRVRITPACAGKSTPATVLELLNRDHPRMCGEKSDRWIFAHHAAGSPPHVRGKVAGGIGTVANTRITPACAEKSTVVAVVVEDNKDHPRMCGEKM